MSRFGLVPDTDPDADGAVAPAAAQPGRRWPVPGPPRLPLPVAGVLSYACIRVLSLALTAFALRHGKYGLRRLSLVRVLASNDGGHYRSIAEHGYTYPAGELAHASVFSWFPAYPALMDSIGWLPGVDLVAAGLIVTAIAGLGAAWGITTLGLKLTGDPRISLLMVALWAVAPGSEVLAMDYAEALFCALAVWALVALVDRRWLTAAGLTVLAGTVRSTAVALVAAVAVAALLALIGALRTGQSWWRPLVAAVLAPLGLLGYLGYVALATHRLDGWFWIEKHSFGMVFDWGVSTMRVVRYVLFGTPSVQQVLIVAALVAAVVLTLWSLTERIPLYLHVYTLVVVVLALATSANWISSKPRFLLPAVLLTLPLARLLAPLRTSVLVGLFAVLTAGTTWFGLYIMIIARWTP